MGLKEMSRRFRDMMQGAPDPAVPDPRPFNWDAPVEGSEEPRDPAAGLSVETVPLRPPSARPQASPRSRPEEPRPRAEEPRSAHWRAKADVTDFRAVYAEAGITTPAHGYGVEKMAAMLANPHLASRPRDVRATAALAALQAARHQLAQLQSRKQREEDRLLRVVTHFVEPRPQAPAAPPAPRPPIVGPALPADPALKAPAVKTGSS